ncbi:alpha/beta hydrolase [Uliginosibacterium sp. H3]|uniref:Alpha/beta hydrolase n=1 Tax=Uliginosibacterium silvisoli TaxID=3114758 RepID=A0ABU6K5E6_9RHOO|nr:alpha/beta hydrolase [Uliginosibacterium sp. H3]
MPLDSRAKSLLEMLNRIEAPRLEDQPVTFARRNFEKLMFAYRPDAPAIDSAQDMEIARKDFAGGPLRARLYKPRNATETLPVLLWLHGGGWTLGDLACYDTFCRSLCAEAQCAVLALDYRLAPENRFPAALDDALWALRWLKREAAGLGLDAARLAIGGDSAGGNLAAAACHMLREEDSNDIPLSFQLLVYPATDQTSQRASHEQYAEGHFLDRASISWFQHNYLPSESDYFDWRASPLLATDFDGLPPALIVTAECDPLTDDGRAYAEKLAEHGVPVRYSEYAGMIHGFVTMGRILPDAGRAITEMAEALREALR